MRVTFYEETGGESVGDISAPTDSLTTEICGKLTEVAMVASLLGFVPQAKPVLGIEGEAVLGNDHEDLLYLADNNDIPAGRVSSTARKGLKWSELVQVGDVVDLRTTEDGEKFGEAAIVAVEVLSLVDVLDNADHNHVAFGSKVAAGVSARSVLIDELYAAYGPLSLLDTYTVLHILPLNN